MQASVTFKDYKKNLLALQSFVFALPVISVIFNHYSGIPFPPMGDDSGSWRFIAAALAGVSVVLPYFFAQKIRGWIVGTLVLLFLCSAATYLSLESRFVLSIAHSDGAIRFVTRGSKRNPELKQPYAAMNDYDLIRSAGQTDMYLEEAYTKESLHANRQKLFWSYVLTLIFFELILGSVARL